MFTRTVYLVSYHIFIPKWNDYLGTFCHHVNGMKTFRLFSHLSGILTLPNRSTIAPFVFFFCDYDPKTTQRAFVVSYLLNKLEY